MTKDEAFKLAEKFFLRNFSEDAPNYLGISVTKCAERDTEWVCSMLERFIEFERGIIETLSKKE